MASLERTKKVARPVVAADLRLDRRALFGRPPALHQQQYPRVASLHDSSVPEKQLPAKSRLVSPRDNVGDKGVVVAKSEG